MASPIEWVINKISEGTDLVLLDRPAADLIVVRATRDQYGTVLAGVIGVRTEITATHVQPLFASSPPPAFIVNIPTTTPWRGDAIHLIHRSDAAFGSLGDLARAAHLEFPGSYRERETDFFHTAIRDHTNVSGVTMTYDKVFRVERHRGDPLTIAMVNAYHISAEDVRNARARYGEFDIAVKVNGHGSVTTAAEQAAATFGAQALTFGEMMSRLRH
ncbi:hypothetical protein ABCR88_25740 [Pseudomonas sp. W17]|uniref:Uncharacterized protein n=1 Tax=Pseudomonas sp. W17 TaxID=3144407 RepID=A0AAU7WSQ5_9PSED